MPFGLFAPQPVAGVAGAIIVVTQLWLVPSGNFAWLNWLTILLACSTIEASRCCTGHPAELRQRRAGSPHW